MVRQLPSRLRSRSLWMILASHHDVPAWDVLSWGMAARWPVWMASGTTKPTSRRLSPNVHGAKNLAAHRRDGLDARGGRVVPEGMNELSAGYARLSTDQQDLSAQRDALHALGL